jgi:hypothetical protein
VDGSTQTYTVTVNVALNPAKAITAFNITSPVTATGTITEATKTVAVTVPYGTAVTAMTATASHTGASISPDPGTARSYASPVTYTVTAADGSTQNYTVTVTVAPNPAKAITAFYFTIGGKNYGAGTGITPTPETGSGSISGTSVTVTVPYGTAVTAMTATVNHTGASINPNPGTAKSYASPVTYTVTATDGTTAAYTVTVNVPAYGYTYTDEGGYQKVTVSGTLTAAEIKTLLEEPPEGTRIVDLSGATVTLTSYPSLWKLSITKIILPDDANDIHDNFFVNTQGLKTIEIASSNANYEAVDGVLYTKYRTKLVRYPPKKTGASYTVDSVATETYPGAFWFTTDLTQVDLSNIETIKRECFRYSSVQEITASLSVTIGDYVFASSRLTKLVIPSTVTSIGILAFQNCTDLQWIELQGNTPPTAAFNGGSTAANGIMGADVSTLQTRGTWIYVPDSVVGTYKAATGWSVYADRIKKVSERP